MSFNPLTGLITGGSTISTTGSTLSLTGNITGVTTHSDSANATLHIVGDCALNGTCHVKSLKSTLPAVFQSDQRKKKNFKLIENPFYALDRIPGYSFDYIEDSVSSLGFKAQDIEKLFPFLINDTDGTKYVSYIPLIAVNWEATKELRNRQRRLGTRIQALEEENFHLKSILKMVPKLNAKIHNLERKFVSLTHGNTQRAQVDHTQHHGRNHQYNRKNVRSGPRVNLANVREYLRRVRRNSRKVCTRRSVHGVEHAQRIP